MCLIFYFSAQSTIPTDLSKLGEENILVEKIDGRPLYMDAQATTPIVHNQLFIMN